MDLPEIKVETNVDYTFLYFIYGFLSLLGFCIIFSLGKAVYLYYKARVTPDGVATEDSIDTEYNSISNEPSTSVTQIENNDTDSNRLRDQLDKLRRLLNRLNAMGTFSRDTIGDLSAQSAAYGNNSIAASSDLSAFWSSIDFDDFEESTINEGNFQNTPTEKSASVSDFSLDTSGIHFDNLHQKTLSAYSKDNIPNPSKFNHHTNPSDAIVQILGILDSIIQKNRNNPGPLQNNTLKIENKLDNFSNIKALSRSAHSVESYITQKRPMSSSSTVSMNKNLSPNCESFNSDTLISTSGYMNSENLNSEQKLVDVSASKPSLLDQMPQFIESQRKMPTTVSLEANISQEGNVVSSSGSNSLYNTKLSSSSKLLDTNAVSVSRSVAVYIDPITHLSTQISKTLSSSEAVSRESNLFEIENTDRLLSECHVAEISPCTVDIEFINRSRSLSDLLDGTLANLSNLIGSDKACDQKKPEAHNFGLERKPVPVIVISEPSHDSQMYSPKNNKLYKENYRCRSLQVNNNKFSSISSKSLNLPAFSDTVTMKSSISESEIKQSPVWGRFPSHACTSGSDEFLTPIVASDLSPLEKFDWKSPVELTSEIYKSRNMTPHNTNAVFSRKSCIWSTPPSPGEKASNDVLQNINVHKTSSMQNLDKCKF